MDETDMKICLLLLINSRLSYREIADHLGLSVNAVYKRIQTLIELEIIQKFTARIKPVALNAIYCLTFGKSECQDINTVAETIGKHENTSNIMLSSRNHIYIGALLKNIHELDEYSSFLLQTAELQTPQIGLLSGVFYSTPIKYSIPSLTAKRLDQSDLAIIRALHNDSRKPISEIADKIKGTSNTVRRRLNRMIEEGTIDLSIDFNPVSSNDIFSLLQITVPPSQNRDELAQHLVTEYHPHIFFCWTFSNLPNFILCYTWCNNMHELNELMAKIKKGNVETLVPDVLFKGLFYDTWKEKLLYE